MKLMNIPDRSYPSALSDDLKLGIGGAGGGHPAFYSKLSLSLTQLPGEPKEFQKCEFLIWAQPKGAQILLSLQSPWSEAQDTAQCLSLLFLVLESSHLLLKVKPSFNSYGDTKLLLNKSISLNLCY